MMSMSSSSSSSCCCSFSSASWVVLHPSSILRFETQPYKANLSIKLTTLKHDGGPEDEEKEEKEEKTKASLLHHIHPRLS